MENFKLKKDFFQRDTHLVAKELLGKVLVRKYKDGRLQAGIIVEDEAYHGFNDKASHASKNMTERNKVMYGEGGHYYVYFIYGMYWNLNIVTGEKDFPSAILIRALEPVYDSEIYLEELNLKEKRILGSGPGRLCRWMGIDKSFYGNSVEVEQLFMVEAKDLENVLLCHSERSEESHEILRFTQDDKISEIVTDKRIGVDYAKESAGWEWRYYLKDNPFVSK